MFSSIKWTTKHPTIKTFWLVNDMWKSDDLFYQKKLLYLNYLTFILSIFIFVDSRVKSHFLIFLTAILPAKERWLCVNYRKLALLQTVSRRDKKITGLWGCPQLCIALKSASVKLKNFGAKSKQVKKPRQFYPKKEPTGLLTPNNKQN